MHPSKKKDERCRCFTSFPATEKRGDDMPGIWNWKKSTSPPSSFIKVEFPSLNRKNQRQHLPLFPLCFVAATFPFAGDFSATVLSRSNCSCAKLRLVLAHLLSPLARSLITGIGRAAVFFLPRGRQQRSREPSPWTALDTAPPSLFLLASCSPCLSESLV